MRTKILIFILSFCGQGLMAQTTLEEAPIDTSLIAVSLDTLQKRVPFRQKIKAFPNKIITLFDDETPQPKKALWMTFILPGTGQAYNNKHWKIPIVYAGIGGLSYAISYNTRNFKRYKTAYINRLDGDDNTIEEPSTVSLSDAALQNVREGYRQDLERSYLGLIGFYALVGVDAYVDAHLQGFDVSDDLSWEIRPSIQEQMYSSTPSTGMTLSLTFGYRDQNKLYLHEGFENIQSINIQK